MTNHSMRAKAYCKKMCVQNISCPSLQLLNWNQCLQQQTIVFHAGVDIPEICSRSWQFIKGRQISLHWFFLFVFWYLAYYRPGNAVHITVNVFVATILIQVILCPCDSHFLVFVSWNPVIDAKMSESGNGQYLNGEILDGSYLTIFLVDNKVF